MIGDALEDVTQVAFGIEIVEFRGAEERIDCRGALSAILGPGKEPVLAVMHGPSITAKIGWSRDRFAPDSAPPLS